MNKSDMKLLFFDIDGTILTDDGRRIIPESTKEAIKQAKANGHMTFINTGRVHGNIEPMIKDIGFNGFVCGCGTYIRCNHQVLFHNELSPDYCKEIAMVCRKYGMQSIFEHTEHTAYDKTLPGIEENEILKYFKQMDRKLIDDIESPDFVFDKFASWYNEESNLKAFREYIEKDFTYIDREGDFCEIIPKGYSKATGIEFLLKYFDVPLENVYTFGDSNNDLEMLEFTPNSIAMGVCTPEVEAVASYKTDTVLNDGIYKAMKHFNII